MISDRGADLSDRCANLKRSQLNNKINSNVNEPARPRQRGNLNQERTRFQANDSSASGLAALRERKSARAGRAFAAPAALSLRRFCAKSPAKGAFPGTPKFERTREDDERAK